MMNKLILGHCEHQTSVNKNLSMMPKKIHVSRDSLEVRDVILPVFISTIKRSYKRENFFNIKIITVLSV